MYQIDLFCRVIDNWGDAGVCWRLTRQLAAEFDAKVRLIIDDTDPLRVLASDMLRFEVDRRIRSQWPGIEVEHWADVKAGTSNPSEVAPVVIEAFACDPPERYLTAMAERARSGQPPVWINLEYLSAEAWVDGVHGLPSPHPRLPLVKHFFVPGFTRKSGGLIREHWVRPLPAEPCALDSENPRTAPPSPGERAMDPHTRQINGLRVLSFTYPHAPVAELADALHADVTLFAPLSVPPARARRHGVVPQSAFDGALAEHDLLLVRGEDSFVRAQYAGRPLLWHIYPTADQAHRVKLDAWLERYCAGLDPETRHVYESTSRWFVAPHAPDAPPPNWGDFFRHLPTLRRHAIAWQQRLCAEPDLATRLMDFIATRLVASGR